LSNLKASFAHGVVTSHTVRVVLGLSDIRRLDFGYFVRPAEETGIGQPRVEPILGYVVGEADNLVLFDTGMGEGPPELESHYRPTRRSLSTALAHVGVNAEAIRVVVNCHLHFDHCGGNPLLANRPIVTQATELAQARSVENYTLRELVDFAGVRYEEVNGEAELMPNVWVIPTPGHTEGHQSLVVRCLDGTTVLAGQAYDLATQFASEQLARQAQRDGVATTLPSYRPWLERLLSFDPSRVLFAHDHCVWEPA
jgi:glyoxylase-like metal-dependent hydrolase (beta-lactamase superfamily II)